jgi:hypothetical protein
MPTYFAQLWSDQKKWLDDPDIVNREPFVHTSGNVFLRTNVGPGDFIYALTVRNRKLYLLGRLKVGHKCSQREAMKRLESDNLWLSDIHLIAEKGSERRHVAVPIPARKAEGLTFETNQGEIKLGPVDGRKLQTVRRLTEASVHFLDQLLEAPPKPKLGDRLAPRDKMKS